MTLRPYPPARAHQHLHQPTRSSRWPRTILLVEDEPFVREATHSILESAGFKVVSAGDADTAIKLYEASPRLIDLVMTDMVLPGRTGQQLCEELRHRCPDLKILLTSGYSSADYSADAPKSHTYFLAKPYSRRGLVAKIEEMFRILPLGHAAGKVS